MLPAANSYPPTSYLFSPLISSRRIVCRSAALRRGWELCIPLCCWLLGANVLEIGFIISLSDDLLIDRLRPGQLSNNHTYVPSPALKANSPLAVTGQQCSTGETEAQTNRTQAYCKYSHFLTLSTSLTGESHLGNRQMDSNCISVYWVLPWLLLDSLTMYCGAKKPTE